MIEITKVYVKESSLKQLAKTDFMKITSLITPVHVEKTLKDNIVKSVQADSLAKTDILVLMIQLTLLFVELKGFEMMASKVLEDALD